METLVRLNSKILIDYRYLVGLCALIRQADLSIDRCRWTSWEELHAFYKGRADEEYILNSFIQTCEKLGLTPCYHRLNSPTGFKQMISTISFSFFKQRNLMTLKEIETCYYLLVELKKILMSNTPEPQHTEKIRYELGGYYHNVLLPRLKKGDADKVLKVEHYLQNDILQTIPLSKVWRDGLTH